MPFCDLDVREEEKTVLISAMEVAKISGPKCFTVYNSML